MIFIIKSQFCFSKFQNAHTNDFSLFFVGRSISAYRVRGGVWSQIGIGSPQRPQVRTIQSVEITYRLLQIFNFKITSFFIYSASKFDIISSLFVFLFFPQAFYPIKKEDRLLLKSNDLLVRNTLQFIIYC